MPNYKPQRKSRYQSLMGSGFLAFEAGELSRLSLRPNYMREMIRERELAIESIRNTAELEKLTQRETRNEIVRYVMWLYRENKYELSASGVWQMYREFRARAIDLGEYKPRRRGKKQYSRSGKRIDKGRVQEQRARARARKSGR